MLLKEGKINVIYFNFTVLKLEDGIKVPNPNDSHFSKHKLEHYYAVDVRNYPELFFQEKILVDDEERLYWYPRFFDGFKNFPLVCFDERLYNQGEKCFKEYDPYNSGGIKKGIRRKRIDKTLSSKITTQVEVKKIRKVILAIINNNPELKIIKEVKDFINYSIFIENEIKKYPKEEIDTYIDLHKIN